MTIGIAAHGPRAGAAILAALAVVEAIGKGAVGGFVSLAAISGGNILRAETQVGGSRALFDGPVPAPIAEAMAAVLMSSGPNRPEPLAQFTPADPSVGLLTGHRFPNAPGTDGLPLNLDVLARMRAGAGPNDAVTAVLARNSLADAGLIALTPEGELFAADSPLLRSFEDRGAATLRSESGDVVSVIHNAILPYRGLALIAAETALMVMARPPGTPIDVLLGAGVPILAGRDNAINLGPDNRARSISVIDPRFVSGSWSFGLGYRARVRRDGIETARLAYEPYLVARDGRLVSVDGADDAHIAAVPAG